MRLLWLPVPGNCLAALWVEFRTPAVVGIALNRHWDECTGRDGVDCCADWLNRQGFWGRKSIVAWFLMAMVTSLMTPPLLKWSLQHIPLSSEEQERLGLKTVQRGIFDKRTLRILDSGSRWSKCANGYAHGGTIGDKR